jgi:hypothetical protein
LKTPFPFEPFWEASYALTVQRGKGLLPAASRANLMSFTVVVPGGSITVFPWTGKVTVDHNQVAQVSPGELVWNRRMEMELATTDTNADGKARCIFYSLGIGAELIRIFEDGSIAINAQLHA